MSKIVLDKDGLVDLSKVRTRTQEPFVSVKKNGIVKFNVGVRMIMNNYGKETPVHINNPYNVITNLLCDPDTKKFIFVFGSSNANPDKKLKRIKTIARPQHFDVRGKTQRLGEISLRKDLFRVGILPLPLKSTEHRFEIDDGLTIDTENFENEIVIQLEGTKGQINRNEKPNSHMYSKWR